MVPLVLIHSHLEETPNRTLGIQISLSASLASSWKSVCRRPPKEANRNPECPRFGSCGSPCPRWSNPMLDANLPIWVASSLSVLSSRPIWGCSSQKLQPVGLFGKAICFQNILAGPGVSHRSDHAIGALDQMFNMSTGGLTFLE